MNIQRRIFFRAERVVAHRLLLLCLLLVFSCLSALGTNAAAKETNVPICRSGIFSDDTYLSEAVEFYAVENVYVKFECLALSQGNYTLQLEWVTPKGLLQNTSSHTFTLDSEQDYVVYFTFSLNRNGLIRQTFSGEEYAQSQIGEWKMIAYLNDRKIGEDQFRITQ